MLMSILSNPRFIYFVILLIVASVGYGFIYVTKKYNITIEQTNQAKIVLDVLAYLAKNTNFKYSDQTQLVIKYCYEALDFVNTFDGAVDTEAKKVLILDKTMSICKENNLEVDKDTVAITNEVIDYFVSISK